MSGNGSMTVGELLGQLKQTRVAAPAGKSRGFSDGELKALAAAIVDFLRTEFGPELLAKSVTPKLDALRVEIAGLKAQLAEKTCYGGVWSAGNRYRLNEMVTHGGNLWCCEVADTLDQPGTSDGWVLMQKTKGRQ